MRVKIETSLWNEYNTMDEPKSIRELILKEVLPKGHLLCLATADENGPWASYVVYLYDEEMSLYWASKEDTRHSKALLKSPRVAGAISVNHRHKEDNIAVQFSGHVEKISSLPEAMATSRSLKPGEVWYRVRPEFIDLIYEPLFGFEKQRIDLT